MSKLNDLLDQSFSLRDQRRDLEAQASEIKKEEAATDAAILEVMLDQGIDSTRVNGRGSVSVKTEIVPSEIDWDAVIPYVRDNDLFELMYRRLNAAVYRDFLDSGYEIPGVKPFEITKLNKRAS